MEPSPTAEGGIPTVDKYGVYRTKVGDAYVAHDVGGPFVKNYDRFTYYEKFRLAEMANLGLSLFGRGWRSRLARLLMGIDADGGYR